LVPSAHAAPLPGLQFYHGDHLGSAHLITNETGQVLELAEHTPFGSLSRAERTTSTPAPSLTPIGFTGQRTDPANGLVLFPGRIYDPELGRFLQPDPFVQDPSDPQTLNRYSYVRNNPVTYVDPSGYFFVFIFAIISAIIEVAVQAVVAVATLYVENAVFQAVVNAAIVAAASSAFSGSSGSAPIQETASPRGPPGSGRLLEVGTGQKILDPVAFVQQNNLKRLPIFINGIRTTEQGAIEQANQARIMTVFYNPSAGAIADFSEASIEKFLGPTEIDLQLLDLLNQLAEAGVPVEITAFSQGTLIVTRALASGGRLAEGSVVRFHSSAVSRSRAESVVIRAGGQPEFNSTAYFDPINLIQDLNRFKMYGGAIGLLWDLATGFKFTAHRLPANNATAPSQ
jgi:RHS repeat-associated protein